MGGQQVGPHCPLRVQLAVLVPTLLALVLPCVMHVEWACTLLACEWRMQEAACSVLWGHTLQVLLRVAHCVLLARTSPAMVQATAPCARWARTTLALGLSMQQFALCVVQAPIPLQTGLSCAAHVMQAPTLLDPPHSALPVRKALSSLALEPVVAVCVEEANMLQPQGPLSANHVTLACSSMAVGQLPASCVVWVNTFQEPDPLLVPLVLLEVMPTLLVSQCAPCACLAHMLVMLLQAVHCALQAPTAVAVAPLHCPTASPVTLDCTQQGSGCNLQGCLTVALCTLARPLRCGLAPKGLSAIMGGMQPTRICRPSLHPH